MCDAAEERDRWLRGLLSVIDRAVVIRGGGDLGSGTALRLWRCGFPVVILETSAPLAVRRTVAFSEAVYEGTVRVEEAVGRLTASDEVELPSGGEEIPVVVDPRSSVLTRLRPAAVVDAIMAKRNTGTRRDMAAAVVALGPGFRAGTDVDAVVETNRGPYLGRVIWEGEAAPDDGLPGAVMGRGKERVLRAPNSGTLDVPRPIGDIVEEGDVVARVGSGEVRAPFDGLIRGMLRPGTMVTANMKIGDLDPRLDRRLTTLVSDKALAVAGGVVEAILMKLGS